MERRIKTGIFSGSFNPIHTGHLIIANYLCQFGGLDEVWFVVSPQNPMKDQSALIDDRHRVAMVERAIQGCPQLKHCDIELSMPRPSYTIRTLDTLREQYPDRDFHLIIGADNWAGFDRWKEAPRILNEYSLVVYPRQGYPMAKCPESEKNVILSDAPVMELSSTFIRNGVKQGKNMTGFVPAGAYDYMVENRLYL
ncbi:MAG: nicotinate-nucleotide adenylyltransferase [Coprobacter sp.]|nr:nicotinate-nucleotide adenylyltransferase [Coprobacter sp.]